LVIKTLMTFCFGTFAMPFVPLGVLLVMKTLKHEWYMVITAYKITNFENFRARPLYYHISHVRDIPTYVM